MNLDKCCCCNVMHPVATGFPWVTTGIVTAPAVLESTSHVFAHGLDQFYTRVQPAATFDLLAEDFPYALLVLLVAAMIIGSMALRLMASRTVIKAKWQ